MIKKVIITTLFLFYTFNINAQKRKEGYPFGILLNSEKEFTIFEKDTTANAVFLYERGDNYFDIVDNRIQVVKKYHAKIKIINDKGFDQSNISIPLYHHNNSTERIKEIKAVTHNGDTKINLIPSKIYEVDINDRWKDKRFTFPNVKEGSILEYSYTIVTPYIYNFNGWSFQSDIPKLYSEFNAKIPGNYVYNRSLIGSLNLSTNDATVKKGCFHVPGYPNDADCEVLKYAMENIPAFKEEEEYMLAASNYISRIDFELQTYLGLDGSKTHYTKSWKDVDREFKTDKDIGRQLTKTNFFEKNVPQELLTTGDALTKAKNIYNFVQNHYTWNGKYGIYRDIRVKEAFDEKKGNIGEINISLINLLNSAGIKTNLMLLSTRNRGLPKKAHPVMSDFNYIVAKIKIDEKDYLLDASEKLNPFGMLPFRCLNYYGRVMDFKNDSYWYDIKPEEINKQIIRTQVKFNLEENKIEGITKALSMGYNAVSKRNLIHKNSEDEYLNILEDKNKAITITSYELNEEKSNDKKVSEKYTYEINDASFDKLIYFNPFVFKFFSENPFTLEERNYPVDFGYKKGYKYNAIVVIPEGYALKELPTKKSIAIAGNQGNLQFECSKHSNNITVNFSLSLNQTFFPAENYSALKELFKHVTDVQNNSLIVLEKE